MKKSFLLCVIAMITLVTYANAQVLQEVVYLKNGSVIKGAIVEQIPNESIKIRTNDGSIFAYQMSEVEKITKEDVYQTRNRVYNSKNYSPNTPLDIHYRGFVDLGFTVGTDGGAFNRIDLTTSHGAQIFPQMFVGAGIGVSYFYDFSAVALPIFANIRTDLLNSKTSPFVDFKIGYSLVDLSGFYLSPTIGCRFNKFSVGLSYIMQKAPISDGWYSYRVNLGGISIKFGIEF